MLNGQQRAPGKRNTAHQGAQSTNIDRKSTSRYDSKSKNPKSRSQTLTYTPVLI